MILKREVQAKMIKTIEELSEAEAKGIESPSMVNESYPNDIVLTDFIDQICEQYENTLEKSIIIQALNRGVNRAMEQKEQM